jgi:enterochelin esterase-like enzyme
MLVGAVLAAWLAAGLWGLYVYVHRYDLYRGFPPPRTPAGVAAGSVRKVSFRSPALAQTRAYYVYLPPHYAAQAGHGRRFPVLYLLHGYPGQPKVFLQAGAVGVEESLLVARHRMPPTILVMPEGEHGDSEWANASAGHWMDFVLDVVRDVDRRFATRADRRDRGIAGLSEGAYGALNITLHHLDTFSVAESWSGYFRQTPTTVFRGAPPATIRANSPADYVRTVAPDIRRLGLRAWLYQGRTDSHDPAQLRRFSAELHSAGADVHYGFFPGGHDWGLWRAQTPRMLTAAGRWFSESPTRGTTLRGVGRSLPTPVLRRIKADRRRRCLAAPAGPHSRFGLTCRHWRRQAGLPT